MKISFDDGFIIEQIDNAFDVFNTMSFKIFVHGGAIKIRTDKRDAIDYFESWFACNTSNMTRWPKKDAFLTGLLDKKFS